MRNLKKIKFEIDKIDFKTLLFEEVVKNKKLEAELKQSKEITRQLKKLVAEIERGTTKNA